MFDNISIVTTAVSSFNNAALYSPYFFITGLFCAPLFLIVFLYGQNLVSRFGMSNNEIKNNFGILSIACLVLWLLIFGGNYAVIRDGISWLPSMIATVLFLSFMFLIYSMKRLKYTNLVTNRKWQWGILLSIFALAIISAFPSWWGILLQLSAVLCGIIVGDRLHTKLSPLSFSTVIFTIMTILILMQPEYFRFGQLGNLTLIHTISLLLCAFFGITTLVTKYTNANSKIHESAYIKLKWLCRILLFLSLILFLLTESVPVFMGLIGICGISEMLFIYHNGQNFKSLAGLSWAILLTMFGIIIICPVISMFGIIYLSTNSSKSLKSICKDFIHLL